MSNFVCRGVPDPRERTRARTRAIGSTATPPIARHTSTACISSAFARDVVAVPRRVPGKAVSLVNLGGAQPRRRTRAPYPRPLAPMADARADDAVAIPPAPNWYGSNLADWGGADGELYAYAARNAVVLLRPLSPDARHAGALVGHTNRVTALCFARGPGAAHLLISGSADKNLRLWDTTARRCLRVLRGHAAR